MIKDGDDRGELPEIQPPVRSFGTVDYDESKGHFELGTGRKTRTLSVHTA